MATVIQQQAPNQALLNALGQGASNFVGGRIQAGQQKRLEQQQQQQQQAQMQDLVALSQALQGGNPQQALAGFQPQSPQGAQGLFNLTSQLMQPQTPIKGVSVAPGSQLRNPVTGELIAEGAARPAPKETVGDIRAERIRQLQAIPEERRTERQTKSLDKLLEGVSPVNINLGKPASAAERTAIAETAASLDSLDNLENLFQSAETDTGPITGRVSPTKGLLGLTTQDQEDFMAASSTFENKVIKDITGAQMSEKEATRILKQVPRITDPPTRWKAKLKQTRKNLELLQRRRAEILEKSGIVSPDLSGISQQLQGQLQTGEILVKDKATGQIGALPKSEFNPNLFEKVE